MADHAGKQSSHNSSHKPSANDIAWADRRAPRIDHMHLKKNIKPRRRKNDNSQL